MENITLPFERGRMEDIDLGEPSQPEDESSAMEVDGASSSQQSRSSTNEKEANIIIDYSSLNRKLKDHDDPAEVRNMANELTNKVAKIQSTLQRIQAPNMKALEK